MKFESLKHTYWQNVSEDKWTSWAWQLQNKITTLDQLARIAACDPSLQIDLAEIESTQKDFQFGITPYYFSLIKKNNLNCPIRLQALPTSKENVRLTNEFLDFPKEETMMPVPGLTHRYPDRAMLYTTHHCAMYCRFCTRKRKVSNPDSALQMAQITNAIEYVRKNTDIREMILSGGDILSFSDNQLDQIVTQVRSIPHIDIIRLGTRNLVTLPFRITDQFVQSLKKHLPLFIHTHFNHPDECTQEARVACRKLRKAGFVLNNHTVILKNVNDSPDTLRHLNEKLLHMGVQPYYAYHCDLTFGSHHFRTDISSDRKMIRQLHQTTDWMKEINIPHYMVDTPGGGKIELN